MELGLSLGFGRRDEEEEERISGEPPVKLTLLLPSSPPPRAANPDASTSTREFDVNRLPPPEEERRGGPTAPVGRARSEGEPDRESSEEENGMARKKLRLSKEQSVFLEESFKEHNTLNPKQKLALSKQLNLRPRQVEVWFQNRRARTKLKQTEVDCEYLKRCCETLTEENRRLHKELAELRALKTTASPFFKHLPATTLSMCPSCERTTTTTTAAGTNSGGHNHNSNMKGTASLFGKKLRFYPFVPHPATSPAS